MWQGREAASPERVHAVDELVRVQLPLRLQHTARVEPGRAHHRADHQVDQVVRVHDELAGHVRRARGVRDRSVQGRPTGRLRPHRAQLQAPHRPQSQLGRHSRLLLLLLLVSHLVSIRFRHVHVQLVLVQAPATAAAAIYATRRLVRASDPGGRHRSGAQLIGRHVHHLHHGQESAHRQVAAHHGANVRRALGLLLVHRPQHHPAHGLVARPQADRRLERSAQELEQLARRLHLGQRCVCRCLLLRRHCLIHICCVLGLAIGQQHVGA